ncbi:hypothetical protein CL628_00515 [bacterium]|jgi:hypothetical protein|nr:hypothetical protein [bacterium]
MDHLALQRYFVKKVQRLNRDGISPTELDLILEFIPPRVWWRWPQINYILIYLRRPNDVQYRLREALEDSIGVYLGYNDGSRDRLTVTKEGRKLISWAGFVEEAFGKYTWIKGVVSFLLGSVTMLALTYYFK